MKHWGNGNSGFSSYETKLQQDARTLPSTMRRAAWLRSNHAGGVST